MAYKNSYYELKIKNKQKTKNKKQSTNTNKINTQEYINKIHQPKYINKPKNITETFRPWKPVVIRVIYGLGDCAETQGVMIYGIDTAFLF